MDEDFFKDYPPADGSIPAPTDTAEPAADDPMSAFIMGDAETPMEPHGDSEEAANGGPPDTATTDDEPECPAVTQWRLDFAKNLEEKVRKEREVKAERAERAAATLQAMYARWQKTSQDAADANRKVEVDMIREID